MKPLRVVVLAPDCNPDSLSTCLVGYSHAEALARINAVTLMIRPEHERAVRSRSAPFHAIEVCGVPWLDRLHGLAFRWIFGNDYRSQVFTAFSYFSSVAFECAVWRQLKRRLQSGEFDVVLRLMPITSVLPSALAYFLRKGPVPFVIGPINGGLPWPLGFSQAQKQKQWVSDLRNLYRLLPFARSTYRHAAAIIAGSSQTYAEFSVFEQKLFFVPENGVRACLDTVEGRRTKQASKLELIFVGGLVPYKACDLALRAAAPLLRNGVARFTIVGDGPDRSTLERLVNSLGIADAISFCGTLDHGQTLQRFAAADVLVFPSIREFGGGVVFEALAMGTVPIVVDFGGPGDIVNGEVGYKVPLTSETEVVGQIERILTELASNPAHLKRLRLQGLQYAREHLTWDAKARVVTQILKWVAGRGPKPRLPSPKAPATLEV